MSPSLKTIALISGGKDSLFSILHCLANGHIIVALANLYPPPSPENDEDLNSYMYQTVGHSVIPLYEEALGIPLYREEIRGSAVNSARDYSEQEDDETESLIPLLKRIMAAHPDANAVSTGAIFSTYQRTRVENVALRLGLTPLSYLWQYPVLPPYTQSGLLSDMQTVGQDARIIKVASGGLDESFLWANVADMKTVVRMKKAIGRFSENGDGALLGEGGEFETLAIDGPGVLWKKRIVVEEDGVNVQAGGTAIWRGKEARVVEKSEGDGVGLENLRRPPLYDSEFARLLEAELDVGTSVSSLPLLEPNSASLPMNKPSMEGNIFVYANITGETTSTFALDPKFQLTNIFLRLQQGLAMHDIPREAITHCTLLLRNMADFSELNGIYAKYFSHTNPPARVTVAVGDSMPSPYSVTLSIIAHKDTPRNGLHVQSQSYWAPANIGPYSQAITVHTLPSTSTEASQDPGNEVHIAGQIPLNPASMQLYTQDGFKGEAILSLQHLWRIGRERGVRWWNVGVAFLPSEGEREEQERRVLLAQKVWDAMHTSSSAEEEEAEEIDAWDRKNLLPSFNDNTLRRPIPDYEVVTNLHTGDTRPKPPCFVVEVDALPKLASIEWSSTGLTASQISVHTTPSTSTSPRITMTESAPKTSPTRYCTVEITGDAQDMAFISKLGRFSWATLYVAGGFVKEKWKIDGVSWVPCKRVWGEGGREIRGLLVGRCEGSGVGL